jgi:nitrite reductase/ring-hydroxylating ferredoxin subunit
VEGFLRVAAATDVAPGGERVVSLLGRKILVRRDRDGVLTSLELACRHQNADLSSLDRNEPVIVCPRHGWRYDTWSGACLDEPWASLRRFPVREADGFLWVGLKPE